MKTDFYVICAGQGQEEVKNIWPSQGYNGYLTQESKVKVKNIAEELETLQIERLYCGPSNRSKQTAQIISIRCDIPIYHSIGLRNVNYGIAGGYPIAYTKQKFPQETEGWLNPTAIKFDNCFEEGESVWDVLERVFPILDKIYFYQEKKLLFENWRIGIITHSGVITALLAALGIENMPIKDCDVVHITRDENGYKFRNKLF